MALRTFESKASLQTDKTNGCDVCLFGCFLPFLDYFRMKRNSEERFQKGVAELHQRIGRAEIILDTQLVEDKTIERSGSR